MVILAFLFVHVHLGAEHQEGEDCEEKDSKGKGSHPCLDFELSARRVLPHGHAAMFYLQCRVRKHNQQVDCIKSAKLLHAVILGGLGIALT